MSINVALAGADVLTTIVARAPESDHIVHVMASDVSATLWVTIDWEARGVTVDGSLDDAADLLDTATNTDPTVVVTLSGSQQPFTKRVWQFRNGTYAPLTAAEAAAYRTNVEAVSVDAYPLG